MVKFKAKKGTMYSDKDAEIIGPYLREKFPKGTLNPKSVVEKAKSKSSPLYDYFEWDNKKASDRWRIHQARNMIGSILVVESDLEHKEYQSPVYIEIEEAKQYVRTDVALEDPDIWNQVLKTALN